MPRPQPQLPLDTNTFNNIRKWYLIALLGITLMILGSQVLIQWHIQSQIGDSRVINVAGRQRAYSQKLVKEALLLVSYEDSDRQYILSEFKKTLQSWQTFHLGLQAGIDSLGVNSAPDRVLASLFEQAAPHYRAMSAASETLLQQMAPGNSEDLGGAAGELEVLLSHEREFLKAMDSIVNEYDRQSHEKLKKLRLMELLLFFLALLILVLELLFIFRPLAHRVRRTIQSLLRSQNQAEEHTATLEKLYSEKQKSLQSLQELTFAIDHAALFASVGKNGQVEFISRKFLELLGKSNREPGTAIWELLAREEGQQQYLREVFKSSGSTIRKEEIFIEGKEGPGLWLDMSVIPIPDSKSQSTLILCTDITERKRTQQQVEELTRKTYEEGIRQKQHLASQIVEGQERERRRIARDIHDGIGQMLTALKFNIESINLDNTKKSAEKIEYIKELSSDLIKGIRTATFNLTPPELADHGIFPALQKMTVELSKLTGERILFENSSEISLRFPALVETNLYRVVQEAVNNAIKYADANYILVRVNYQQPMLSILIDDDGKGFESEKAFEDGTTGMGLLFMKERVNYINGRLFINSVKGKGTRVTINYNVGQH